MRFRLVRAVRGATPLAVAALVLAPASSLGGEETQHLRGRIVFAKSAIGVAGDIYTVDPDGRHLRRLTRTGTDEEAPSWSPDGKSIVYVNASDGNFGAVYLMRSDGTRRRRLFREFYAESKVDEPTWSPDGRRIAFTSSRSHMTEIWIYALKNKRQTQLTKGWAVHPSWSPDGRRLAYTGRVHRRSIIVIVRSNGRLVRRLSGGTSIYSPVWSPNGRWIAFGSSRRSANGSENDSLEVMTPTGKARRRLLGGGTLFPVAWSPDSDALLFLRVTSVVDLKRQLFIVSLAGGKPSVVPGTEGATAGSWHR